MPLTASHIIYYLLCPRKLWLYHRGIRMEGNSQAVAEGQFISETTYRFRPKRWKELVLEGGKIDHYDPVNKLVREVKKSAKLEHIHIAQVKYYLYILEQHGIEATSGIIEYPKQKRTTEVYLSEEDRKTMLQWFAEIREIMDQEHCPDLLVKPYCKNCAYRDFCFV